MSSEPRPPAAGPPPSTAVDKPEPARYDHAEVEPRWQRYWQENETFKAVRNPGRTKFYVLDMFPYPSGAGLHVGHPEGYTATDIVARFLRMRGHDVLHPMGWDAFGLPAEQHAIKTGTHPGETTRQNIAVFKRQLQRLGFSYDWSREIDTTNPHYVRWTQWIFLQLFKRGLAYQDKVNVNWCPALGTVLANEEVVDGKSDIGGHPVTRTPLRQWLMGITKYADRLVDDLVLVDWPRGTLTMQREWIGRSEGAWIRFAVADHEGASFEVFTTRPDTLMGATYAVLAPEHPLVNALTTSAQRAAVEAYVVASARKSDRDRQQSAASKEKTGVPTGSFAVHPISGLHIPIWVADYVLGGYGTGAVMAVPAHDTRDFDFAMAHALDIVQVVVAPGKKPWDALRIYEDQRPAYVALREAGEEVPFIGEGTAIHSGEFDELTTADCKRAVVAKLEALGCGGPKVTYKLRDWVFSRQRYWGEPIPIYFPVELDDPAGDPRKGARHTIRFDQPIAVDEADLPLRLPDLADFRPGEDPAGPLARAVDWRFFQKDGAWYARETNTMPQWAGSCWYYLRFIDPRNDADPWSQQAANDWLPVDLYVGGAEHAVLHLLYARFWHKVLFDLGHVNHPEPFVKLVHQGMILGEDGEKMSKSRGNVVNPDDIIKAHGADVLRLYEMFMGPLDAVKPWQSAQISGAVRFRDRLFVLGGRATTDVIDDETRRLVHKTIKKVTHDFETLSFNTAITALMVLTNHLHALDPVPREAMQALALLISPLAPHLGEELWHKLGHAASLAYEPWPAFDEALCIDDVVEHAVQVNGKVRGRVALARGASEDDARAAALVADGVPPHLAGKTIKKFIYVAGKIINVVVG